MPLDTLGKLDTGFMLKNFYPERNDDDDDDHDGNDKRCFKPSRYNYD